MYQGGSVAIGDVGLRVRLVDDKNTSLVDVRGVIGADRFDANTRAADHRFGLPLADLSPGEYLLTFEATVESKVASRMLRFSVR